MKREADEQRLAEFRGLRTEAWRIVRDDLERLQADIADRGIAERIKDRVGEEAREVWDATRDVATEHKGVVAATVAVLVAWLLRGPIGDVIAALFRDEDEPAAEQDGRRNVVGDEGDIS
jgi:hypothetical protein